MSNGNKPNPVIFILSGLFAGILIGVGIALLLQHRSAEELLPIVPADNDTLHTNTNQYSDRGAGGRVSSADTDQPHEDSESDRSDPDLYLPSDTTFTAETEDTISAFAGDAGEVIHRDIFVGRKKIRLITDSPSSGKKPGGATQTDSLLTSLTAVKPSEGFYPEYTLEFWKNPLNYRGYKVIKDRIIIFGLPLEQQYQLMLSNNQLTLITQKLQYPLREADDYTPLTPKK